MPKRQSRTTSKSPAASATARAPKSQASKKRDGHEYSTREPAILEPRVRKIPQATITSKWSVLSQTSQQHARDTLRAAKRSVVMSHWDERRRVEADLAINAAVKNVEKKMPRMKFPPRTKEIFFNLDKLTENSRLLESQLTSAIHSVELLKAEIKKEEGAMDMDRERLVELQANAKAEYKAQTKRAAKTHPLLQIAEIDHGEDTAEEIRLREPRENIAADLTGADPDIASLYKRFSSQLDSLETNHEQFHGLREVIMEAEIDLDRAMAGMPDIEDSG